MSIWLLKILLEWQYTLTCYVWAPLYLSRKSQMEFVRWTPSLVCACKQQYSKNTVKYTMIWPWIKRWYIMDKHKMEWAAWCCCFTYHSYTWLTLCGSLLRIRLVYLNYQRMLHECRNMKLTNVCRCIQESISNRLNNIAKHMNTHWGLCCIDHPVLTDIWAVMYRILWTYMQIKNKDKLMLHHQYHDCWSSGHTIKRVSDWALLEAIYSTLNHLQIEQDIATWCCLVMLWVNVVNVSTHASMSNPY